MRKYTVYVLIQLLFLFAYQLNANEDSIRHVIRQLDSTLKDKNMQSIEKYLAPDFSIDVTMLPRAAKYFQTIIDRETFSKIDFISVNKSVANEGLYAKVNLQTGDGKQYESIIGFNDKYQVTYIDYFDRLYGNSRFNKSELKAAIPFRYENGQILLSIKLNDNNDALTFLFDTGADGMAIKKSNADKLGLKVAHTQNASIVGGQMQVTISSGNKVNLTETLFLLNQNIAIFEEINDGIDGIIGLNIARDYITKVNFDSKQIELYTFGDYEGDKNCDILPVFAPQGIILIPGMINIVGKKEVKGNFVFDTGAAYHFIGFSHFVRKNRLLLTGFKPESSGSTMSMGHVTPVYTGKTYKFQLTSHITFDDMPVTLQASTGSGGKGHERGDGSIGIEVISKFNFTIDLLRKRLYLQKRD